MRLHKRHQVVREAQMDLECRVIDWTRKYDLTWCEAVKCLQVVASRYLTYILRLERHPNDPGKKADEA